jgi:hypothetical protein
MPIQSPIFAPAIVLVLWSLLMLAWLAVTRLPAMARSGIDLGSIVSSRGVNLALAWAYVGLRIAHSIVQAVWNRVSVRFALFSAATVALLLLAFNAARVTF